MTTTVNIHPAGHKIRVTTIDKATSGGEQDRRSTEVLEPGSAARTFHAHQTRSILIEEITPADEAATEERSPIGSAERVVEDLQNYRDGKPTR